MCGRHRRPIRVRVSVEYHSSIPVDDQRYASQSHFTISCGQVPGLLLATINIQLCALFVTRFSCVPHCRCCHCLPWSIIGYRRGSIDAEDYKQTYVFKRSMDIYSRSCKISWKISKIITHVTADVRTQRRFQLVFFYKIGHQACIV